MDADLEVRSSLHAGRPLYPAMYARAGILQPPAVRGVAPGSATTPRLNNAPTFEAFIDEVIECVTIQGTAAPSSVGDGITIGASSRPSLEALKCTPVEIWDERDLEEYGHAAEVACFEINALNLNLRHEPYPPRVAAAVRAMIADGIIDSQWGVGADPSALGGGGGGSGLGADIDGEAPKAEPEALQSLLLQAQGALEQAERDAEKVTSDGEKVASVVQAEALVSALKLSIKQHAESAALRTPTTKPTVSSGRYTIAPRRDPPPKKAAVSTPKTLADQASVQQLQRMGAGALYRLHKALPKLLKVCCGSEPAASTELMPPAMLTDVAFRLEAQNAVLQSVMGAYSFAATESASATLASISGKAADTTFSRLIHEGVAQLRMSPVDRLFGIK